MIPKSELQLANWMKDNCYNFNSYSIGGNIIYEGYGIEKSGALYIWYHTERGVRTNIDYFQSEEEIIKYAYGKILNDNFANSHCIGFTSNKLKSKELATILTEKNIKFTSDEIPFNGKGNPTYRTFVFGCDINKVKHLKSIYLELST